MSKASENLVTSTETLAEWGEFRLLNEVVLPLFRDSRLAMPIGDDCAFINVPKDRETLVVTTDVGPTPLARSVGDLSFQTWGWYSVLVNVSDLASSGAYPLAFTSSVEAPPSMLVTEFRDFFDGIAEACQVFSIPNAGGNIRAAPRFECHGTAIGTISLGKMITRSGCQPGDTLVIIGTSGNFVSAYLKAMHDGIDRLSLEEQNSLLRPRPQLQEMITLTTAHVVSAATDNSDGILGSLWNIAERSQCGMEILMEESLLPSMVRETAYRYQLNPWNVLFFWGDWQIVASIKKDCLDTFLAVAADSQITYHLLGHAVGGPPALYGRDSGSRKPLRLLRNENFVSGSFNAGVDSHVNYMLRSPIFV